MNPATAGRASRAPPRTCTCWALTPHQATGHKGALHARAQAGNAPRDRPYNVVVKRLVDPYDSLGSTVPRIFDLALLFALEITAGCVVLALDRWEWIIWVLAAGCATSIWEAMLLSKLRVNVNPHQFPRTPKDWMLNALRVLPIIGVLLFNNWTADLRERAYLHHDAAARATISRTGHVLPWFMVAFIAVAIMAGSVGFVLTWRRASKLVSERVPADPGIEMLARELDAWLTGPKPASR